MSGVNDFVLRFANVNGTGSASANGMVAKSFFELGLDIGPKNMFPSNIQGMPTWYEVRVSDRGYTGRRGDVDFMVAMNPQTFIRDQGDVSPGGYLLYDSTKALIKSSMRSDINYLGVPLTSMCLPVFPNPKSRSMLKNIIYVGALAGLLDIPLEVLQKMISEQFKSKPKLIESNFIALNLGYEFARKEYRCPLPICVKAR
ncbi:MAG: 2-oxoacid:acceptor oxidoreductase family protein, partial [Proteobacteria bacterium]|nr:2-oxoacid:acceptor oxidoreductase family protein [Pseudomonadota bacterium]